MHKCVSKTQTRHTGVHSLGVHSFGGALLWGALPWGGGYRPVTDIESSRRADVKL